LSSAPAADLPRGIFRAPEGAKRIVGNPDGLVQRGLVTASRRLFDLSSGYADVLQQVVRHAAEPFDPFPSLSPADEPVEDTSSTGVVAWPACRPIKKMPQTLDHLVLHRGNAPAFVEMMGAVELDTRMHAVWCENVSGQGKPLTNGTKPFQAFGRQDLAKRRASDPNLGDLSRIR
jgi:hypothetical protein